MLVELLLIELIRLFQQFLRIWPESIQEAIGRFLGKMVFLILRDRRAVAISNIKRVFPELNKKGLEEIARGCFVKLGIDFVEFLLIPYLPKKEYPMRFRLHKEAGVEKLMDSGEGIIALAFHFANWEIMGVASVLLKKEIVALARPLKRHSQINDFLNHLRSSTGLKVIPNADTAMDAIRLLREGKMIAVLGDQREKRSKGVYVEFFGEKVPTTKGISMIAMKTGAPVVPVYLVREGFLRYQLVCSSPIKMERRRDIEGSIIENTRKINSFLESLILRYPDEWFWLHRRWGRRMDKRQKA